MKKKHQKKRPETKIEKQQFEEEEVKCDGSFDIDQYSQLILSSCKEYLSIFSSTKVLKLACKYFEDPSFQAENLKDRLEQDFQLHQELVEQTDLINNISKTNILLVGETGEGKSSFINHIIGGVAAEEAKDDQVDSETSKTHIYYKKEDGIYIIDTPGFGDTRVNMNDEEVGKRIVNEVKNLLKANAQIDALFFFWAPTQTSKFRCEVILEKLKACFGDQVEKSIVLFINKFSKKWSSEYEGKVKNATERLQKINSKIPVLVYDVKGPQDLDSIYDTIEKVEKKYNEDDFSSHRTSQCLIFLKEELKRVGEVRATALKHKAEMEQQEMLLEKERLERKAEVERIQEQIEKDMQLSREANEKQKKEFEEERKANQEKLLELERIALKREQDAKEQTFQYQQQMIRDLEKRQYEFEREKLRIIMQEENNQKLQQNSTQTEKINSMENQLNKIMEVFEIFKKQAEQKAAQSSRRRPIKSKKYRKNGKRK